MGLSRYERQRPPITPQATQAIEKKRPIAPRAMRYQTRTNGKIAACTSSSRIYIWEPAFCLGYDRLIVHCLEAFTTGMGASLQSGI